VKLVTGNSPEVQRLNKIIGLALMIGTGFACVFVASLMGSKSGEVASAIGGVIGGLFGGALAAYAAFVGVKTTLEGQASKDDERRAQKIAAIRRALYTEVAIVAGFCARELGDNPGKSAPPLTIYCSLSGEIGLLTSKEIVHLIRFANILQDVHTGLSSARTPKVLGEACDHAICFLKATGLAEIDEDRAFIEHLGRAVEVGWTRASSLPT
jgi:hypothetical protein